MKSKTLHFAFSMILLLMGSAAIAGGRMTNHATEDTQLFNNAELIIANAQIAQEVETVINQLEVMRTNLKKLEEFANIGENFLEKIAEIESVVSIGQAVSYRASNLDSIYNSRYQDFNQYARTIAKQGGMLNNTWEKNRYQQWARTNLDSIQGALRAAGMQSSAFRSETAKIKMLEEKSQSAEGRDQLLQTLIEVAALQSTQLINLRQMIASDIQLKAAHQASLVDRQAKIDATRMELKKDYDATDRDPGGYIMPWSK